MYFVLFPAMYIIPGADGGHLEDYEDTLVMLANNPLIVLFCVGYKDDFLEIFDHQSSKLFYISNPHKFCMIPHFSRIISNLIGLGIVCRSSYKLPQGLFLLNIQAACIRPS